MNAVKKLNLGIEAILVVFLFFYSLLISPIHLAYAQSCTVPVQVTNVAIVFPNCVNGTCSYSQGSCSWAALSGATGYNVIITAVGTNTQVLNQQAYTSTTLAFTVATSDTYRCDVSAINSCGTGSVGTSSLLCKTDFVPTPTPTPTIVPTSVIVTVIPTSVPLPTLPPTGNNITIWLGFAGFAMIAVSIALLSI